MKKKNITLLVGVLVLLVLVLAAWLLLRQGNETKKDAAIKVSQTSSSEVNAMRITESSGHVIEVEKRADGWYYPGEEATSLDQANMESALTVVCYLFAQGTVEAPSEDLADYGLDPARIRVDYSLQDGTSHWVAFGTYTSDRTMVYMNCSESDRLYLYDLDSLSILERATQEMTDLTIDIDVEKLSRIEIMRTSGKAPVIFERIPEEERVGLETWKLTSPFTAIANAEAVSLVQAFFASARYAAYAAPEETEEMGFASSQARILLEEEDGNRVSIRVGARTDSGRYYCEQEGRSGIYELAAGFSSLLEIKDENLRPATILPFMEGNAVRIEKRTDTGDFLVYLLDNKTAKGYNVNDIALTKENQEALIAYLTSFTYGGLATDAVLSGEPDCVVELINADRTLTLAFHPYKNDFYAVELNGSGSAGGYIKAENLQRLLSAFARAADGDPV